MSDMELDTVKSNSGKDEIPYFDYDINTLPFDVNAVENFEGNPNSEYAYVPKKENIEESLEIIDLIEKFAGLNNEEEGEEIVAEECEDMNMSGEVIKNWNDVKFGSDELNNDKKYFNNVTSSSSSTYFSTDDEMSDDEDIEVMLDDYETMMEKEYQKNPLYKTEMCSNLVNCKNPRCSYAHNLHEKRKKPICKFGKMCNKLVCGFMHPEGRNAPPEKIEVNNSQELNSDEELEKRIKENPNYRTSMCKSKDNCKRNNCPFAHNESQLRDKPVCMYGRNCKNYTCVFSHPEGKIENKLYKTKKCLNYHSNGYCKFGDKCNFIH